MNWDAISAVSQILGLIVVVVTLIYLAAQVRQGNVFAKLQARQRMIEQAESELYAQMADPSITYSNIKDGELSEDEQARLSVFLINFLRQREWEWSLYQEGVIDFSSFRAYREVIAIHLGTTRGRKWWKRLGHRAFDPSFVEQVEEVLAESDANSYLQDMRTWDNS